MTTENTRSIFGHILMPFIGILVITIFAIVFTPLAQAQEVSVAVTDTNQATVAWDPVTYENLDAATERLAYEVLTVPVKDPKDTATSDGVVTETQKVVTLTSKGTYLVGVRTLLQLETGGAWTTLKESTISWSDNPGVTVAPFALRFYPAPGAPGALRLVP